MKNDWPPSARGEPTTVAELSAKYIPLYEGEASERWGTAIHAVYRSKEWQNVANVPLVGDNSRSDVPLPGNPWPTLAIGDEFLAAHAAEMDLLHATAIEGGFARYPPAAVPGTSLDMQSIQELRHASLCLRLQAYARAHRKDAAGAAESILDGMSLADSLAVDPSYVNQSMRMAIGGLAIATVRDVLPATEFSESDFERLQNRLLRTDFREGMHHALMGERVTGIETFRDPSSLGLPAPMVAVSRIVRPAEFEAYLGYMENVIELSQADWPEALHSLRKADDDFASQIGHTHFVTRMTVGSTKGLAEAACQSTASCRIAGLAVALERYRRKHGKFAERLDELSPEFVQALPTDPFDGKPFNYDVTATGYTVYSLGRKPSGNADPETGADASLVFRYPPNPKTAGEVTTPKSDAVTSDAAR